MTPCLAYFIGKECRLITASCQSSEVFACSLVNAKMHSHHEITECNISMQHLTIRNVPPELAKALEEEKKRRGLSLNQTVVQLLSQATGVAAQGKHHNGLAALAGTWSAAEFQRFEDAIATTEEVDPELWRP
jgi:hypothetical protein